MNNISQPIIEMNNSSQPITKSQDGRRTTSFSVLRTAAYCVIFTLGLLGNAFVLVALKRKRRKTANDWFILNLTIADLLLIVCLASDVYVELASSPYDTFFCKGMRPLSTVVFSVSIFTMTTMALERHQVITKPFHPRMRQGHARRVITGIWVLSVVITVPLPIVTTAGVDECKEPGWPAPIYISIYTVILVVIQYLLASKYYVLIDLVGGPEIFRPRSRKCVRSLYGTFNQFCKESAGRAVRVI